MSLERILAEQTVIDVLDNADNPTKVAPVARDRMMLLQWLRVIPLAGVILFFAYVAFQVFLPGSVADFLRDYALPFLAYGAVFAGGILGSCFILYCAWRVLKGVFMGPFKR
ncbi:hypothetical protein GCM10010149_89370 [Nonomuraea roseoviolacea subsp. roseoviolacea]|uniref:hypothetical protein n=1 Tax=Nonomuraea roseoviolacea TaxID=103837 RepID=UPI0031E0224A